MLKVPKIYSSLQTNRNLNAAENIILTWSLCLDTIHHHQTLRRQGPGFWPDQRGPTFKLKVSSIRSRSANPLPSYALVDSLSENLSKLLQCDVRRCRSSSVNEEEQPVRDPGHPLHAAAACSPRAIVIQKSRSRKSSCELQRARRYIYKYHTICKSHSHNL